MDDAAWQTVVATLSDVHSLPAESQSRLRPMLTSRTLRQGDHLLREGEPARIAAVVVEGVLREYFRDDQGREHTRGFAYERTFAGSLADLLAETPARMNLEALTHVRIAQVPWPHFDELTRIDAAWDHFARRLAEHSYRRKAEREQRLLSLSAGERYERFLQERGELLDRVPLRHIASYLGITPEHLSRLRRVS
ncbi:MAG: Crp/Fnr family transcriptional regulator [Myxococcota bacterium]